jgi:hypothetical protein
MNTVSNVRVPVFEERDVRVIGRLQGNVSTNKNGNLWKFLKFQFRALKIFMENFKSDTFPAMAFPLTN